jgi:hypothetical protein
MTYTNEQLARCAHREAGFRKQVYPRQVAKGRLSQAKADAEIAQMQQIAAHFDELAKQEELPL